MLSFLRNHQTVFQSGCTICIPTNVSEFLLPRIPANLWSAFWILTIFTFSYVYSEISLLFQFAFPCWHTMWSLFLYTYLLSVYFGDVSAKILTSFLIQCFCFLIVKFREFFVYFVLQSFIRYVFGKYFLLVFIFLVYFLCSSVM